MEKKIFVLTIIDQEKVGSSPDKVFTFSTNKKAVEKMKQLFSQEANVPYENVGERYEDEIANTYFCETYAYINFYWYADINECFVDGKDREKLIKDTRIDIINVLNVNSTYFGHTIDKLLSEYSNEDIERIATSQHAFSELFVGQSFYQHALQELGGKTDEFSTHIITDYLNIQLAEDFERVFGAGNWEVCMLMLCRGDEDKLRYARNNIDNYAKTYCNYKQKTLFPKERLKELTKDMPIPCNHRELCSKLTDDQYYDMMYNVFGELNSKKTFPNTMNGKLEKLWYDCSQIVYNVIWNYGTDELFATYRRITLDDEHEINAEYDFYEMSEIADELSEKYKNPTSSNNL